MLKKILIPVDFSEASRKAFFYAVELAKKAGIDELTVANAFMPSAEADYPNYVPPMADYLKVREKMLHDFAEEMSQQTGMKIEKDLLIGFAADELVNLSKQYDLIVMSTTGEGGFLSKIFGSVSISVARHAKCPVILVPENVVAKDVHHILYACNYESAHEEMLEEMLRFNELFKANVHFVHVRGSKDTTDFERIKDEIFHKLFEGGEPLFGFYMAEISSDSVEEGINDYVQSHQIDLVVMVTKQRSFWEELFHKSATKELALHTHTPVMAFHYED